MWFDRRLACPDLPWIPAEHRGDANSCIDTFMTRSFDEGQSWVPNLRVSAQTWDWTINLPLDQSGNGFIGSYQGIASSNEFDFPFWNATANLGDNPENSQQVFVARVPVERPVLHVGDIKLRYSPSGTAYELTSAVPVLDQEGRRVAAATVRIQWSMPNGQATIQTAVTRSAGIASFELATSQAGLYSLTVLDVQAAGYSYDPGQNLEPSEELQVR
jgi:hypothetical protein